MEQTVFDKGLLAFGSDDRGRIEFDGGDLSVGVLERGINHVLLGEEVLGEVLDPSVTVIGIETCVLGDLVHETLVLPLLSTEASHSAQLRDQIDQLVIGVLLDNEERLVGILNLDVVVFLVVF